MAKIPEILAPAGGMEHLTAAVRSGADAVYLGTKNFNARRNAQNFDDESFLQAVSYCHVRGVKVYSALNTLVFDKEIKSLADEIRRLAECAADGIIVQDIGVAALTKKLCPSMPLHASTQMAVHNVQGVKALEELGFARVVLARELSADEIAKIARETELELEVFVHGALCMSVSGLCYLSSMLGGRSGNRGLCAQPCRLDFKANGRDCALSLRDLSLIESMEKLKSLKISALKIEGRMKRPEYVAAAVTACRDALDGKQADTETLKAVFSRSGFTDGYFTAKRDIRMFGSRTKQDVLAAAPVLEQLAAGYRSEKPLIPVDMKLVLAKDAPAVLEATDGIHTVKTNGPIPEEAVKSPLSAELIARSLGKTGGTPFYMKNLLSELQCGLTLPVSALNGMRKSALNGLEQKRACRKPLPFSNAVPVLPPRPERTQAPGLRVRLRQFAQLSAELADNAEKVILPVEEIHAHTQIIHSLKEKLIGELPLLVYPLTEGKIKDMLLDLKAGGLTEAMAGNLGAFHLAKETGFIIHGDYSMNILNSYALNTMRELGAKDQTLSFETGNAQARELSGTLPFGIIAYGQLPLMTYRNCPAKQGKDCGSCRGASEITDRLQNKFPVVCHNREYSQLLNMLPLYLADKPEALLHYDFITLYFTTEESEACVNILSRYISHAGAPEKFTRGLYFRNLL